MLCCRSLSVPQHYSVDDDVLTVLHTACILLPSYVSMNVANSRLNYSGSVCVTRSEPCLQSLRCNALAEDYSGYSTREMLPNTLQHSVSVAFNISLLLFILCQLWVFSDDPNVAIFWYLAWS